MNCSALVLRTGADAEPTPSVPAAAESDRVE
jgi:hypothetical protein